jgi:hypothetical protein
MNPTEKITGNAITERRLRMTQMPTAASAYSTYQRALSTLANSMPTLVDPSHGKGRNATAITPRRTPETLVGREPDSDATG